MGRLEGKVAIITGGASGMGEATAQLFCREGARVVIADLQEEKGRALAESISKEGGEIAFVRADVSSGEDVQGMIRAAVDRWGGLDVIFNNAGIGFGEGLVGESNDDDWDHIIAVDLKGVYLGMKHAIPHLLARGGGSIVSTASIAGLLGFPNLGAYSAAKGGVIQLTKVVAVEYAARGIRANCICPGGIATPLVLNNPRSTVTVPEEQRIEGMKQMQPIPRAGMPMDIANAALWLASDESSFVTGQAIVVDGGFVIDPRRGPRQ